MATPYSCPYCRSDFKTYERRQQHIDMVHQEVLVRKMRCTTCDDELRAGMKWLDLPEESEAT